MPGKNCVFFGCSASSSKNRGLSFHRLPKNNPEWKKKLLTIIKSTREDDINEKNLSICSRHFDNDCFFPPTSGADQLQLRRQLKPGSLPTLCLPQKSIITKKFPPRKPPKIRVSTNIAHPVDTDSTTIEPEPQPTFFDLRESISTLNSNWCISSTDHTIALVKLGSPQINITISEDLSYILCIDNYRIPTTFNVEIPTIQNLITSVEQLKFCPGITSKDLQHFAELDSKTSKYFRHVTLCMETACDVLYKSCVRSKTCHGFITSASKSLTCRTCQLVRKALLKRQLHLKSIKTLSARAPLKKVCKGLVSKALKESRKKVKKINQQLKSIQKRLDRECVPVEKELHDSFTKILDTTIDDPFVHLFWEEQKKAFSKQNRGHSWHPMMIRLAILLHSQSPAAYRSLRDCGILKMPGESTLRDFTNFIKPEPGFLPEVLEEIKTFASDLKPDQRWVTLLMDEMSIKADLVFDKQTGNVIGFINNVDSAQGIKQNVATHCLVFMVVGVNSNIKYSLGWFPTKTATADVIYPIFWQAVGYLETNCNLKVIAATSDKAAPNLRFFSLHGSQDCHKTTNLFAPDREIFFFSDAPHLLKTLRNNLSASGSNSSRLLWNNGKNLLWKHVVDVYEKDMSQELSKATKLTYNHIHLTSFSVMKVNYAAQVLSQSVGRVMERYGGPDAAETSKFILMVDRFFDCLNVRSLYEGERKRKDDLMPYNKLDDTRFSFLKDEFLNYLDEWKSQVDKREGFSKSEKSKMFLSHQTYRGLVITINSLIEATQFLLKNGVNFVLSNKFCQDPIEEHFGRHRALGRRSENPTVYAFGYQENKLRLQRTLALQIKPQGNVKTRKRVVNVDETPLKKRRH